VIDPVQSEKTDEDEVDSHGETHDPGRDHQEHSRGQGSDWQYRACSIEMHLDFTPDSGVSLVGRRWLANAENAFRVHPGRKPDPTSAGAGLPRTRDG
jgi:hypothetical protein